MSYKLKIEYYYFTDYNYIIMDYYKQLNNCKKMNKFTFYEDSTVEHQPTMSKKELIVLQHMYEQAPRRSLIPNANNGRAYMSCLILDDKYCLLYDWLQ